MNKLVFVSCVFFVIACSAQGPGGPGGHGGPGGPMGEEFKKFMETCKADTGSSDDDIKALMTHQGTPNKNGWCMIACIKKKMGAMDASSNKIMVDKIKEDMAGLKEKNAEMFNKIIGDIQTCKTEMEADPKNLADQCVAAQVFETCFMSKMPAHP